MFLLNHLGIGRILSFFLARTLLSSSTVLVLEVSFLKVPWKSFSVNLLEFPAMHLWLNIQQQTQGRPYADFLNSSLVYLSSLSVILSCKFHRHPLLNAHLYLLISARIP